MIERLSDHYIICGYGRVGRRGRGRVPRRPACRVRRRSTSTPDALETRRARTARSFIEGSGTKDEDLEAAGLDAGAGARRSSDSDVDNLYITLSARAARPDLLIVARASDEDAAAEDAPGRAPTGSSQPYSTAGQEMAKLDAEAAGGGVPRHRLAARRRRPPLRGDRDHERVPARPAGRSASCASAHETGALIVALRKARRDLRHDARPGRDAGPGRRADRRRHRSTSCRRSRSCSRRARAVAG